MTGYFDDPDVVSWGRTLRSVHRVARPRFFDEVPTLLAEGKSIARGLLAVGGRRSYGDSGLNSGGSLIDMTGLDRFVSFAQDTRVLIADAGTTLAQILDCVVPRGFFPPVTPGTRHVTLGGAIANDVHGKNHHSAGTIGRWVKEMDLLRSDGTCLKLTPDDETGLFAATIGGLGLTGLITRVALQLRPIKSAWLETETIPFGHIREFFALAQECAGRHDYTVAWIDVSARGKGLGRGIFTCADHSEAGANDIRQAGRKPRRVPMDMPNSLLNRFSIGTLNAMYYARGRVKAGRARAPYGSWFYPLDALDDWNRLYGRRGFYQYQSVVPTAVAEIATVSMLREIANSGEGSFLVVLKTFGGLPSPGLMSFPMEGTTLALDFPNRGPATLRLLERLDAIVREARGRLYAAKDGRLPPAMFRDGYPQLERFAMHVDSAFSSAFWRRMQQLS